MGWYVLKDKVPILVDDIEEWAKIFEGDDLRRVASTHLKGDIHVSTVFLGLDHQWGDGPPLLFETMIFGGKHNDYQERYPTWTDAEAGHVLAVALADGDRWGYWTRLWINSKRDWNDFKRWLRMSWRQLIAYFIPDRV